LLVTAAAFLCLCGVGIVISCMLLDVSLNVSLTTANYYTNTTQAQKGCCSN